MATGRFLGVLLTLVVGESLATAETYREKLQSDLNEALERTNKMCDTKLELAPPDAAAWEKAGAKAQDCVPILDALKLACRQEKKDEPHPAGQAFVKEKVKSVKCLLLPDKNKSEETVTLEGGVVVFSRVPQYSPTGEVVRLLHSTAEFRPIANAKRQWDLENVDAPEAAKPMQKKCGDDMKLTIDIASWKLAGDSGNNIPKALDIGEMCRIYASGLVDVCGDDKDAVRKKFDGLRCTFSKSIKGKATVSFKGREIVVTSSTTIGFGDGQLIREAVEKQLGKKKKK